MHLLLCLAISVGLALLFPKGFKYMVGTWVGVATADFLWSIVFFGLWIAGVRYSLATMGWSLLGATVLGFVSGIIVAARG